MSTTIGVRTMTAAAIGAALAAIVLVGFRAVTADAVGDDESTFVPMTPCRLLDTRPDSQVGPRGTPLGPDDAYSVQVTGSEGECIIPGAATAVSINLTGVAPSQATFLSLYPGGADNPGTSVVNMVAGQAAVPNKVDVELGPNGKLVVFNRFGNIHVVGDVLGYYRHDGLSALQARILELEAGSGTDTSVLDRLAALEADNAALVARVADLEADLSTLTAKTAPMSIRTVDGQPTVRFTGVNVQVVDGSGNTDGPVNGRGNVIVGYNESLGRERTGSHNLIVGDEHSYFSYGGFVAGSTNTLSAPYATVAGGLRNTASGQRASVLGGYRNIASGPWASVSGGAGNSATGDAASISGGDSNVATGRATSVVGGIRNTAHGSFNSVVGGDDVSCGFTTRGFCGEGQDYLMDVP